MTGILFVGSAPEDLGGSTLPTTSTTYCRDPDFTPVGSYVTGDFDNFGAGFIIDTATPSGDYWLHFRHATSANNGDYGNFADGYWLRLWSGTDLIAAIGLTNDEYYLEGGGESVEILRPAYLTTYTFDIKCTQNGSTVTATVYVNGILEGTISYSSALGSVDRVTFDHFDLIWNTTAKSWHYCEIVVTDGEPTLGWRIASLNPLADGAHTAWDGGVAGVLAAGDGQSISVDAVDLKQSWTLSAYAGPATSSGVRAVVNKFIGAQGGDVSGPANIIPFTRHTTTDEDGTSFGPDGTQHLEVLDNDPNTAATWDTANLAAMQVGVKSAT